MAAAPDSSVEAAVANKAVARRKGKSRVVVIGVVAGETLKAQLKVNRGKRVIGNSGLRTINDGKRSLLSIIRREAGRGPASVTVTLRDEAGNTKTVSRRVRIPR